jgi:preprotein translocase subunit SecE
MADAKKTATADNAGKELPAPARAPRGNIFTFFRDVRREAGKVTWPSWKETWLTTVMVFIMVGLTMVFFLAVDSSLGILVRWVLSAAG